MLTCVRSLYTPIGRLLASHRFEQSAGAYPPKKVPCNATAGYENVFEQFGKWMGKGCKRTIFNPHPTAMDCYRDNIFGKLTADDHGSWYVGRKPPLATKNLLEVTDG